MFTPEIMIKLNYRDDESNWGTLLLSLAFLASLVLRSLLSAACLLPRADPISHTRTHGSSCRHTRTPVGQLQSQCQNIIHMAISSPPPPPPPRILSSCSPAFSFTTSRSCQSSTCTLTWSLTQTVTQAQTRTLTPVHAQTDRRRDGKG